MVPRADGARPPPPRRRESAAALLLQRLPPGGLPGEIVNIRARVIANGSYVVGSDAWSWEGAHDGIYSLRIPGGIWRELAINDGPSQYVAVEVTLQGLATVEALESRIRGVERALYEDFDLRLARDLGLWLPKRE
jgi:hypothetical protein